MVVYVLDKGGKPLMPTKRTAWVAYVLKHGEAKVVKREPFTIQLLRDSARYLQAVTLGVDVGSKHIGLCASTEKEELYSAQVELRDDVSNLLTARKEHRISRRHRRGNWYRAWRFLNRANQRKKDLPPSIRHKAESHIRAINAVLAILPIIHINLEVGKFDIQKIQNPTIAIEQYQNGEMAGWENLRLYAKYRDGYKCRVCGKSAKDGKHLEVHHIIRRADGGTDVPGNVVTLCHECHVSHHQGKMKLRFKRPTLHKSAVAMNSMKDYLVDRLVETLSTIMIERTFGYKTAMSRRLHGIEKSHDNDAYCIAGNFSAIRNYRNSYFHKLVRRHRRDLHKCTIQSPYDFKAKTQALFTADEWKNGYRMPTKMLKAVRGFCLNDTVRYNGIMWTLTKLRKTGFFGLSILHEGRKQDSVNFKNLTRICASSGIITERRIRKG